MNNEIEARPFEEYKEMIKSMSKEKMIEGLYDLSKDCIQKDKEIERLNNIINELEKTLENRLMAVPNDALDDGIEEAERTTKIAIYQVILGDLEKVKRAKGDSNSIKMIENDRNIVR